ncbi:MAG TPA: formylglycine-generating enzyme family protein [Lacipirellulaceae bacterium]|nr:formylglycine-generating enzyme family protein [Lacipirellulaceae bacterium]
MFHLISHHRLFVTLSVVATALALHGSRLAAADSNSARGVVPTPPHGVRSMKVDGGYMVPYTEKIPGTNVSFDMIPIPGGEFLMGSSPTETHRSKDEGPQVRVKVEPFWMGKCEVTWAEYRSFMAMYDAFKKLQRLAGNPGKPADGPAADANWKLIQKHAWNGKLEKDWNVDAVTSPTPLYDSSFTYGVGDQANQPAVTITSFAARQYTKWLSGITGHEYRLPSEAEWEYAARAGTKTAYSFGSDPTKIGDYAWYDKNSDEMTHPVATKKPNPWGLYDVHGNVAEWTLDEYYPNTYAKLGPGPVDAKDAVRWPKTTYPRVIRGGSWLLDAVAARSAARQKSEEKEWKLSDPNIPLSPWWYTEEPATAVGMRVMRPLKPMTAEEKKRAWEADVNDIRQDVQDRLREGRGALGVADKGLPAAVKAAERLNDSN